MAKTGPQKYLGASTAYWYGSKYPGSAMESNVVVWHSTEGTSLPSYSGGAEAPNFTAKPDFAKKKLVWYQHFDFDVSARALVNKSGGVETNTANAVQVEIVGTCDPTTHKKWGGTQHLYMSDLPDWVIRDLAAFAKWANQHHGVKLQSGLTFKAYPSSYGSNGVRLSGSQWGKFYGHCGHQHVPENDHGDPGNFPISQILAVAKGASGVSDDPPTPVEEPVPNTLGLLKDTPVTLSPGVWKTLAVGATTDILTGAKAYTATAQLSVESGPYASTVQGRFYHVRPDGTRWNSAIMENETTDGKTFVNFVHMGSIAADEKLRFEVVYFPLDPTDTLTRDVLESRIRGLYWV